jgi:urea-proton symporter
MPMYGSGYIFSKPFFTGWVTIGIIWIFCSFFGVGLFPIYEGRDTLKKTFVFAWKDLTGKTHPKTIHAQVEAAEGSGHATPPEKSGIKEEVAAS